MSISLKNVGVICTLGQSKQEIIDNLIIGDNSGLVKDDTLPLSGTQFIGHAPLVLDDVSINLSSRNNQLAYHAFKQIEANLLPLIKHYGNKRIAVVIGTSTSGIAQGEIARKALQEQGKLPEQYHYEVQEMVAPAHFIADLCQAQGPVYSISTACSSGAKALVSARALIESDLADVVIAGGIDSLARLTVNGFKSLESVSSAACSPFGENRDGINIAEAAALFIVCADKSGIQLLGAGETSDAYHVSSPAPDGCGAIQAMQMALDDAAISAKQLDYVNLHGTATEKNDDMEAKAMAHVCGDTVLCGSTKGMTGHTLGAAGALEAAICWLLLSDYNPNNFIPKNVSQQQADSSLVSINLSKGHYLDSVSYCMSNSFAFGGNNLSLVLGK